MKKIIVVIAMVAFGINLNAQKYFTKEGKISFFSDAPVEKIEAHNSKATAVFDMETGKMQWAILIKAFKFEKALMQEHFNENYMESSKYPKAKFTGNIKNWSEVDINSQEDVALKVEGSLTIHGVENNISVPGSITFTEEGQVLKSVITVKVADYDIKIPSVVRDNIAKEVEIHIEATLVPLDTKS